MAISKAKHQPDKERLLNDPNTQQTASANPWKLHNFIRVIGGAIRRVSR